MVKSVFVTGTDTDVGKTFVSAILVNAWKSNYWKPFQTGLNSDLGDTKTVVELTRLPKDHFNPSQVELDTPLSPWRAAIQDGKDVVTSSDIKIPRGFQTESRPLVVEGAGGLFVPLNEKEITTDLIESLNTPVILVARSGLGTINHTLLSIEHLKSRGIQIAGIILNGDVNNDNAETIKHFAQDVKIIAQIPYSSDMNIDELSKLIPPIDSII